MKVTVWSSISGRSSGYAVIDIPDTSTCTVQCIIDHYCQHKCVRKCDTVNWQLSRSGGGVVRTLDAARTLDQCGVGHGDQLVLMPGM